MNIADQLLVTVQQQGLPVIFGLILIAAMGVPLLPVSLILVAAGSFAKQGRLPLVPLLLTASAAAIMGDHIGYVIARWGGRPLLVRIARKTGTTAKMKKAEELTRRWGATGIFFTRWLVTELGPWVNVASGIARFPGGRFSFWVITGEVLWVVLCVMVGYQFGHRSQYLAQSWNSHGWVLLAFAVGIIVLWKVMGIFHRRFYGANRSGARTMMDVFKRKHPGLDLDSNEAINGLQQTNEANSAVWWRFLGSILAQLAGIVPRAGHLALSRTAAMLFDCRGSSLLIRPYCKWNYGDSEYWRRFEPGSRGPTYRSFQDFFTRNLRTPLVPKSDSVWPCDGLLCQVVPYKDVNYLRIKGEWMRARSIFAIVDNNRGVGGVLYNVFLHNRDYHHIHSPVSGRVTRITRIPGKLFLLRPWAYDNPSFPALRNERVVIDIEDDRGMTWSLAIVGGPLVGTIELCATATVGAHVQPCEKLASFRMGSTCCLLAPIHSAVRAGSTVGAGDRIG